MQMEAMKHTRLNSFAMFNPEKIIQFRKQQALGCPRSQSYHSHHTRALLGEWGRMENSTSGPNMVCREGGA